MSLKQFDPSQVSIVFAGIPLSGFADGDFVVIEANEDSFSLAMGTDGEGTRSKSNNRSGRVTISTMQSSDVNLQLSTLHNADILGQGDGVGPLQVKDNSGTSLYVAQNAWITRPPGSTFSRTAQQRQWIIESEELVHNVGGN